MTALALLLGLSLVTALGSGVAVWMLWRTCKRRAHAGLPAKLFAVLATAALAAGVFATCVGVVRTLAATGGDDVEPSQKARQLGEAISLLMNAIAAQIVILVPSAIVLFVLAWLGKRGSD